jgi:hypothetical protein
VFGEGRIVRVREKDVLDIDLQGGVGQKQIG